MFKKNVLFLLFICFSFSAKAQNLYSVGHCSIRIETDFKDVTRNTSLQKKMLRDLEAALGSKGYYVEAFPQFQLEIRFSVIPHRAVPMDITSKASLYGISGGLVGSVQAVDRTVHSTQHHTKAWLKLALKNVETMPDCEPVLGTVGTREGCSFNMLSTRTNGSMLEVENIDGKKVAWSIQKSWNSGKQEYQWLYEYNDAKADCAAKGLRLPTGDEYRALIGCMKSPDWINFRDQIQGRDELVKIFPDWLKGWEWIEQEGAMNTSYMLVQDKANARYHSVRCVKP